MNDSPEELASLYVLDQLGPDERADFAARLLRDPALAALVDELAAGLEAGVRALPRQEPPADVLDRIEGRLDALRALETTSTDSPRSGGWKVYARWGLAAVIAVSLTTLAYQGLRPAARPAIVVVGLDLDRSTVAELPLDGSAQNPDARFIQLASLAENYWAEPRSRPFKPDPASGNNHGYALFDPGSRQGFIAIEQLPVAVAGQRYHLWVHDPTSHRVLDAGVLPLGGRSRGLYSFALGPDDRPLPAHPDLFVTIEDPDAAPPRDQPRGRIVLGRQSF